MMQHITLTDAYSADYSIEQILAFPQHWTNGVSWHTPVSGRPNNGLMYILNCENTMRAGGETLTAKNGQIVCIPQGIHYRAFFSKSPNHTLHNTLVTNYLINFNAKTLANEPLTLSDRIIVFTPTDSTYFKDMFEYLVKKCKNPAFPPALLKACVFEIITELSKQFNGSSHHEKSNQILTPAIDYISENCFKEEISISYLAEISHVSEATLRRMFYNSLGMSPKSYINSLKINRAKILLKSGSLRVCEVSRLVGFEDASYFTRFFKKHTGINPTRY